MRKLITLVITSVIIMSMFSICAGAYRVGDVTGYALSTDIAASINGYDIPSYNVDGYTYIVVEDLQYYGFSVIYDNASRTLSVTRDLSQEYVSKVYEKPYVSEKNTGKREHKIFYTDIVTYLDGNYVPAQNIGGQTIIRFDALSAYGGVSYDNCRREISLELSGVAVNPNPVDREKRRFRSVLGVYQHSQYDCSVVILEYDGENITFEITSIGQRGNRIAISLIQSKISDGVFNFVFKDSFYSTGYGTLKILDNGNLSVEFGEVEIPGMWSITYGGDGIYYRSGDVPYGYVPTEIFW